MGATSLPMVSEVCLTRYAFEPLKTTSTFQLATAKDVFNLNSKRSLYRKAVAPCWCRSDSQAILSEFRHRSQFSISRTSKPRRSWSGWNLMRTLKPVTVAMPGSSMTTLVFPMTVTIPTVGKVTIEHAGPRPAHVKDRPNVRQCAEDVAAHWRNTEHGSRAAGKCDFWASPWVE